MKSTKDIPGWFDYAPVFDRLIQTVSQNGAFVEGGAWLGKSSSYLCDQVAMRRPDIEVFIVDTWRGSKNELDTFHKLAKTEDIYALFLENMGYRKFKAIRQPSDEASKLFQSASIDVMFIDMEHTFEAVTQDIRLWFPKVKTGGWIAGHDYRKSWPGVVKAVRGQFDTNRIVSQNNCWMVQKTRGLRLPT